ncbi:hypothetical protein [Bacillus mycoides]|uniref:hypothetical protein n=1 Tax=Bacillus mycoides TaxID=1405 RepID=UPI002078B511|nr:hypothetical protein [Bacillus mycoides]
MEDRMKEARKSIKISEQKFNNASTHLTEFETKLNSKYYKKRAMLSFLVLSKT